jgi:hypothetical protein
MKTPTMAQMEVLGQLADKFDNVLAAQVLPMPAAFHLDMAKSCLKDASNVLKRFYTVHTGQDPWEGTPFAADGEVDVKR